MNVQRLVLACSLAVASAMAQALEYRITVSPTQPLVGRVEVTPSAGSAGRIRSAVPLNTRGQGQGMREAISNVQCDAQAVPRAPAGWVLPSGGCRRLSWSVAFSTLSGQGSDASAQDNLYHPGTRSWILSEPTALLRWPGLPSASIVVRGANLKGFKNEKAAVVPMPVGDEPPVYLLIGNAPIARTAVGPHEFTYARLAPGSITALAALEQAHAQALTRFAQTLQVAPPTALTVWLPIDQNRGGLGAASGAHTVLANVPTQKGIVQTIQLPYALAAVLQTQFAQQMTQIGGKTLPAWLSLSLTEYYVRKALHYSALDAVTVAAIENSYPPPDAAPSDTLLGLQVRLENEEAEAYQRLLGDGSNFWQALDRAIQVASSGVRSLDDELPHILTAGFTSAQLPETLRERLRLAAGEAVFGQLQARYLGPVQ